MCPVIPSRSRCGRAANECRRSGRPPYAVQRLRLMLARLHMHQVRRAVRSGSRRGVPEEPSHVILEIDAVRYALQKVVGSLREQYKAGGVEVEELLSKATGPNKNWAYELVRQGWANPQLLEKGDAAVENLKRASIELAKLIANLR